MAMVKMSSTERRTRCLLIAAAGLAVFSLVGAAQVASTPAPAGVQVEAAVAKLPDWDVVSVRSSQLPCTQGSGLMPTPDGINLMCLPLQVLVKRSEEHTSELQSLRHLV